MIPVRDGARVFPAPLGRGDDDGWFKCLDPDGHEWDFRFKHRAKRSESRVTYTTPFVGKYGLQAGDSITITAPEDESSHYRISFDRDDSPEVVLGEEELEFAPEGTVRRVWANSYERDPRNKALAKKLHGTACFGCDLEMSATYGEIAAGFIHIHHVIPLSELDAPRAPDPRDLVPLCPNCHAVVHLRKRPLTIAELRERIRLATRPTGPATSQTNP
ncbi:HNH endonuclease [Candidatus Poriferisodalis sp.]|uniref:HNH endonuclease n=1 Tax=Candidatus Poriferisodalis sp. TaxID=3101277 RepID=UPI003B594D6A